MPLIRLVKWKCDICGVESDPCAVDEFDIQDGTVPLPPGWCADRAVFHSVVACGGGCAETMMQREIAAAVTDIKRRYSAAGKK